MSESQKVSLNSSDGTHLTVSDLKQAATLISKAFNRVQEINDGTYRCHQPPILFDADTSKELLDVVAECFYATNDLVNYILHIEE